MEHQKLVEEIVREEWDAFDKVQNIGGRAPCQDDWRTFYVMRAGQYLTWTVDMLARYLQDFKEARRLGRNPVAEKYAWMMQSTDPVQFAAIKNQLPLVSESKRMLVEQCVRLQVGWLEEFARQNPKLASRGRKIHSYEDRLTETSYETYLRGELYTYSDEMLLLYSSFLMAIKKLNGNLAEMTMQHMQRLYASDF